MRLRLATLALLATAALQACSPALNWRQVALGQWTVLLPCKPDQAQRAVRLGSHEITLTMVGCEATGALFAVSQTPAGAPDSARAMLADWRAATLQSMGASDAAELPIPAGHGQTPVLLLEAQGKRPDGSPVQARLAWWLLGGDIVHMAVYADHLSPEMTEAFMVAPKRP